jgi:hypothetical protein
MLWSDLSSAILELPWWVGKYCAEPSVPDG